MRINPQLMEKIKESLSSVLPITAIVLLLSVSIVPLTTGALVLFLFGSLLLIVGVGVFTLGVDMSMTPMGSGIGAYMGRARHMAIPLAVAFALGVLIPMAEDGEAGEYAKKVSRRCDTYEDDILAPSVATGVVCKTNIEETLEERLSDAEYEMFNNKFEVKNAPGYRERLEKGLKK